MPLSVPARSCVTAVKPGDLILEFKACFIPVGHFPSSKNKLYRSEVGIML